MGWASIWFILTSMEQQGFACFNKFLTITTDDLFGLHQIESKKKKKKRKAKWGHQDLYLQWQRKEK